MSTFSVVIPTLQRATTLPMLLERLERSPAVAEVIVINNAARPLAVTGNKIMVLDQTENLFVNPAWNLGVAYATAPYLALCNDDIVFPTAVFDRIALLLRRRVGIVGPDTSCFQTAPDRCHPRFRRVLRRPFGYGTLMCLRRDAYTQIPDSLKIWYGDDYLFWSQPHRNFSFSGVGIQTQMGTTASAPEFSARLRQDQANFASAMFDQTHRRRRVEWTALQAASSLKRRLRPTN